MTLTSRLRARVAKSRQSRDFGRALSRATTPSLRNELLTIAARHDVSTR